MSSKLYAGVSRTDISPKLGVRLGGYPHEPRRNTGIHDPLYATAIYIKSDIEILLISIDILLYSKKHVKYVREKINQKTDIPQKNIMIFCTHTHSGPRCSGSLDKENLIKGDVQDPAYNEFINKSIIKAGVDAKNSKFSAKISFENIYCGKKQGVGGNRRDPNGICDPYISVMGIKDKNDILKAASVRYSLHPTVLHADNILASADYPGYIRSYIEDKYKDCISMFMQGTSGDQSTRYFRTDQTFKEAKRIGNTIAKFAINALEKGKYTDTACINSNNADVDFILKDIPDLKTCQENEKNARVNYENAKEQNKSYIEVQNAHLQLFGAENQLQYAKMRKDNEKIDLLTEESPAEVNVITINDNVMVFFPGEIFVEFGLQIKDKMKPKNAYVVSVANGCLPGYACTPKAYINGGYEAGTSMLTGKMGKKLVDTAIDLIKCKNGGI